MSFTHATVPHPPASPSYRSPRGARPPGRYKRGLSPSALPLSQTAPSMSSMDLSKGGFSCDVDTGAPSAYSTRGGFGLSRLEPAPSLSELPSREKNFFEPMKSFMLEGPSMDSLRWTAQPLENLPSASTYYLQQPWPSYDLSGRDDAFSIAVEPAVSAPYVPSAGSPPRKLLVQRKKQQYHDRGDIAALLIERGLGAEDVAQLWLKTKDGFQIEMFDSTDFDIRTPTQWMKKSLEDSNNRPLACTGLKLDIKSPGLTSWKRCCVKSWDPFQERFTATWDVTDEEATESPRSPLASEDVMLSRLQVCFDGEDPEVFADRLVYAAERREVTRASIQYEFLLDNMPTDDVPGLPSSMKDRLKRLGRRGLKLQVPELDETYKELLAEVENEYRRVAVRFVLERVRGSEDSRSKAIQKLGFPGVWTDLPDLLEEDEDQAGRVRFVPGGAEALRARRRIFHMHIQQFGRSALCSKREVIRAMSKVHRECLRWMWPTAKEKGYCMFLTGFQHPSNLVHFKDVQKNHVVHVERTMNEVWVQALQKIVRKEFDKVGKGWYNLHETEKDMFDFGKLRRVLRVIQYMMQDTLVSFISGSVQHYVDSIEQSIPLGNDRAFSEDRNPFPLLEIGVGSGQQITSNVLFSVTAVYADGGLEWDTDLSRFSLASAEVLDVALMQLAMSFVQLDKLVLPQFNKVQGSGGGAHLLSTVRLDEPWVAAARIRLQHAVSSAIPKLQKWIATLRKIHVPYLSLNPAEYANDFVEPTAEEIHKKMQNMSDEELDAFEEWQKKRSSAAICELVRWHLTQERLVLGFEDFDAEGLQIEPQGHGGDQWIPSSLVFGCFRCQTKHFRETVAGAHHELAQALMRVFRGRFRQRVEAVLKTFEEELFQPLRRPVRNIEELVDLKQFMKMVPMKLEELSQGVMDAIGIFDELEELGTCLDEEEMSLRWEAFGAERRAITIVEARADQLHLDERNFHDNLRQNQKLFKEKLKELEVTISHFHMHSDLEKADEIADRCEDLNEHLRDAREQVKLFTRRERIFGGPQTDYSIVDILTEKFESYSTLWGAARHWRHNRDAWMSGRFMSIDAQQCQSFVTSSISSLTRSHGVFEQNPTCAKLIPLVNLILEELQGFRPHLPLIMALRGQGMRPRHFREIAERTGTDLGLEVKNCDTSLQQLLAMGVSYHMDLIVSIGDRAAREHHLEQQLNSIQSTWEVVEFTLANYRNTRVSLLTDTDRVLQVLDEHVVQLQGMETSPYRDPFKQRIKDWSQRLALLGEILDEWLRGQRQWIHLQPIFAESEIVKQLPAETKRFHNADQFWRETMKSTREKPLVVSACAGPAGLPATFLQKWKDQNAALEAVQRGLEDYLETKRGLFPQFRFLANTALLEVLSFAKRPDSLKAYWRDLFGNFDDVVTHSETLEDGTENFSAISVEITDNGETLGLIPHVALLGHCEGWLQELQNSCEAAVLKAIRKAVENFSQQDQEKWTPSRYQPLHTVITASAVLWCMAVDKTLSSTYHNLRSHLEATTETIKVFSKRSQTKGRRPTDASDARQQGREYQFVVLTLLQAFHRRDLLERMIQEKVTSTYDFNWMSQLRHSWDADSDSVELVCGSAQIPYGNQYVGLVAAPLMVFTPLTERCFLSLSRCFSSSSLHCGALVGPHSSGKVQTMIALAGTCGMRCIVGAPGSSGLLKGVAACHGVWACFKNIELLPVHMLAAVSMQVSALLRARVSRAERGDAAKPSVEVDGSQIWVARTFGVSFTFSNIAELRHVPELIRNRLRPLSFAAIHIDVIIRSLLQAQGFDAREAKNLKSCLFLLGEFMSVPTGSSGTDDCCKYDFGLRTLSRIIKAAVSLRSAAPPKGREWDTSLLLGTAIVSVITPQIVSEVHLRCFWHQLAVHFPLAAATYEKQSTELPAVTAINPSEMEKHLNDACQKLAIQPSEAFNKRIRQLLDGLGAHVGTMLVGATMTAKSACLRLAHACAGTLAESREKRAESKEQGGEKRAGSKEQGGGVPDSWDAPGGPISTLNPVVLSKSQLSLWGKIDPVSGSWSDGVATDLIRTAARTEGQQWIAFDGPLEPTWSEPIHPVMSDVAVLTTTTGEAIQVKQRSVRLFFEMTNLASCSPAMVTSALVIFFDQDCLTVGQVVAAWVQRLQDKCDRGDVLQKDADMLIPLVNQVIERSAGPHHLGVSQSGPGPTVVQLVQGFLTILDLCMSKIARNSSTEAGNDLFEERLKSVFVFSIIWGLGALLPAADGGKKERFSQRIRTELGRVRVEMPFETGGMSQNDWHAFTYSIEDNLWSRWDEHSSLQQAPSLDPHSCFNLQLPTEDSLRAEFFLTMLLPQHPVLLSGTPAAGLTSHLKKYFQRKGGAQGSITKLFLGITHSTKALDIEGFLGRHVDKRRRGVYGPQPGRRLMFLVDDVNIASGMDSQELMRQWNDKGGWHYHKERSFCQLVDFVTFATANARPGRPALDPRLGRHYIICQFGELPIQNIFDTAISAVVEGPLKEPNAAIQFLVTRLGTLAINVLEAFRATARTTPQAPQHDVSVHFFGPALGRLYQATKWGTFTNIQLIRCWSHEILRAFEDRLEDGSRLHQEFLMELKKHILEQLREKPEVVFQNRLVFTDLPHDASDEDFENIAVYEEVPSWDLFKRKMQGLWDAHHAATSSPVNIIFFDEALCHICRLVRILRAPQGHALLIGCGGDGKRTLSGAAAAICDQEVVRLQLPLDVTSDPLSELKALLLQAGTEKKKITAIITFRGSGDELQGTICTLGLIAAHGDDPTLFNAEEFEAIRQQLANETPDAADRAVAQAVFAENVRQHFRLVLCCDKVTPSIPCLGNCQALMRSVEVDVFRLVPIESLYELTRIQLQYEVASSCGEVFSMPHFLETVCMAHCEAATLVEEELPWPQFLPSPRSFNRYMDFLIMVKQFVKQQAMEWKKTTGLLRSGVERLLDTATRSAQLEMELREMQPKVQEVVQQVQMYSQLIKEKQVLTDEMDAKVRTEEANAADKQSSAQAIRDDAQRDLKEALPPMEHATEALRKLKMEHIRELVAMQGPSSGVLLTMEVLCILFGIPPVKRTDPEHPTQKVEDYWETVHNTLLREPRKLLEALQSFDKDSLSEEHIQKLSKFMELEDFQPFVIRRSSVACEAVCLWVRAAVRYHFISRAIEPKRIRLRQAESELDVATQFLEETRLRRDEIIEEKRELEAQLLETGQKREQLQQEMEKSEIAYLRATTLLAGIGENRRIWSDQLKKQNQQHARALGDAVLAAVALSLGSPMDAISRQKIDSLVRNEVLLPMGLPHSPVVESNIRSPLLQLEGSKFCVEQWRAAGLSSDSYVLQCALHWELSSRWPLLLDPTAHVVQFIRLVALRMAEQQRCFGAEFVRLSNPNWTRVLERSLLQGKWLVIDITAHADVPMMLEQLLLGMRLPRFGGVTVTLAGRQIPVKEGFRLFLHSSTTSPSISPGLSALCSVVNCAPSDDSALESLLLRTILKNLESDLEERQQQLQKTTAAAWLQARQMEYGILQRFATTEGDILDNEDCIRGIARSQNDAKALNITVEEQGQQEAENENARRNNIPIARRCVQLYSCLNTVQAACSHPCGFSVQWFQRLVRFCITSEIERSSSREEQTAGLLQDLTRTLFQHSCRSLFEPYRLVLAFLLACQVRYGDATPEFQFLITPTKQLVAGINQKEIGPCPGNVSEWLSEESWWLLNSLSTRCKAFQKTADTHTFSMFFVEHAVYFGHLYQEEWPCLQSDLPEPFDKLTTLEKVCFWRAFRPSIAPSMMRAFAEETLGAPFLESIAFSVRESRRLSTSFTPLVWLLPPPESTQARANTDATGLIENLGSQVEMNDRIEAINVHDDSFAHGVPPAKIMEKAFASGNWLVLHLHSATALLQDGLSEMIWRMQSQDEKINANFRLWIVARPSEALFAALEPCVTITMASEPPLGYRACSALRHNELMEMRYSAKFTGSVNPQDLLQRLAWLHTKLLARNPFLGGWFGEPLNLPSTELKVQASFLFDWIGAVPSSANADTASILSTAFVPLLAEHGYGSYLTYTHDLETLRNLLNIELRSILAARSTEATLTDLESSLKHVPAEILKGVGPPEAFGIHTCAYKCSSITIEPLNILQKGFSKAGVENHQAEKGCLENVFKFLNDARDQLQYYNRTLLQKDNNDGPMAMARWQNLCENQRMIAGIVRDLEAVKLYHDDSVVTGDVERLFETLCAGCVPIRWENLVLLRSPGENMEPSSIYSLAMFLPFIYKRLSFFRAWFSTKIIPVDIVSLNQFSSPKLLLNALIAEFAGGKLPSSESPISPKTPRPSTQHKQYPFDDCTLEWQVSTEATRQTLLDTAGGGVGICVTGICLEACRWMTGPHSVASCLPFDMRSQMPMIHIKPVLQADHQQKSGMFRCPLFRSQTRTDFVIDMELPCTENTTVLRNKGAVGFVSLGIL